MDRPLLPAAALLFATFLAGCGGKAGVEAKSEAASSPPTVAVAKASRDTLDRNLVLTAEFKPFQEVEVMAKVSGYVKKIYVDVGDRVRQGQLLATLEVPEMGDELVRAAASIDRSTSEVARARDEVRRTEAAHQMAHLSYERLHGVSQTRPGLIAQQEIDDAHSRDLVSEAQVAAAKSNLATAEQTVKVSRAEEAKSKTLYNYAKVTAPFTGVITKRFANDGAMVQAGTASQTQAMPVVRLSQNSLLRLILPVPESQVPRVRLGQQVEVRVPTLDRSFPGKVARMAERVDPATRTMETEVDVQNGTQVLVPGMYAEVDLRMEQRRDVLAIPISALEGADGQQARVYLVGADGKVAVRPVKLGLETATQVEVRSGLEEGDLVVVGNRSALRVGQAVRPKLTQLAAVKGE